MFIALSDLEQISDSALDEFQQRVKAVDPSIRWEFDLESARLESQLLQLYRLAAMAAKNEDSLEQTHQLWSVMVRICDAFAVRISELCAQHPACSASHDRILAGAALLIEQLSRDEIEALAKLYDRFAHALDPFDPARDEAEHRFDRKLVDLHLTLAPKTDFREFRREAVRACKSFLRKNP